MRFEYDAGALPGVLCARHPEWVELYDATWKMAFNNIEFPLVEGWKPQLTCMPGMGKTWQWDSCFMTLFARYSNGTLPGMNNLDNLYRMQREDGFIAMAYLVENGRPAFGERINPPLFAWVEWEYFRITGDESRFPHVFPRLVRYFDWLKRRRTRDNGLYWFEDSGSSGMDNSPRGAYYSPGLNGSDLCHVDLACQQALAADRLARIAARLDRNGEAGRFLDEANALRRLINHYHWCDKTGFYYDVFLRNDPSLRHNFVPCKTVAGFWPLLAEVADAERQRRLIKEHLLNPAEFATLHPVPALSRDDPNYDPLGAYWNGGVWPPTNHMIVRGLIATGYPGTARQLVAAHLTAMAQVLQSAEYPSIWECYAPEFIQPATKYDQGDLVRKDFVGWSGLGPIAGLLEAIMGLECEAGCREIRWCPPPSEYGDMTVRNLRFNGARLTFTRTVRPAALRVACDRPTTIALIEADGRTSARHALTVGEHVLGSPGGRPD